MDGVLYLLLNWKAQKKRDLSPRPGIIAISATGEAQLDMARLIGASHTLQKPVRPDILLNAVADLARRSNP